MSRTEVRCFFCMQAICTYVRSRLEYASLVWSPIYDVHSSLLERVQRRFLKNVVFMLNGAYPPRGCPQGLLLGEVGLQSLLDRRMEHSVIFLFKLFRGLQECPHVLERISLRVSRSGSRVRSVFYIGQRHTDIGLKSPVTRMLRNYQCRDPHRYFLLQHFANQKILLHLLVN
jgi:hypothetical protein